MKAMATIAFVAALMSPANADQGAAVYIDDGIAVVLTGEFYFDSGWGMCIDGDAPEIVNRSVDSIWQTRIGCRGKGKRSGTVFDNLRPEDACSVQPKYTINYRGGLWQIHVFCLVPASTS